MVLEIQCHVWALGCFCYNGNVVGHEISWKNSSHLEMFLKNYFNDNSEASGKIWRPAIPKHTKAYPEGIIGRKSDCLTSKKWTKKVSELRVFDRNLFLYFAQFDPVPPQIVKKWNLRWEHLATFTSEILEFQLFRLLYKIWARFLDVFNGWIWAQDSWSFQCMHPSKHSINIVWSMCFKYTNWFFPFLFVVFSFFLIPNINNNKKKNPDENGITFDKRDMREYLSVHATTLKVL